MHPYKSRVSKEKTYKSKYSEAAPFQSQLKVDPSELADEKMKAYKLILLILKKQGVPANKADVLLGKIFQIMNMMASAPTSKYSRLDSMLDTALTKIEDTLRLPGGEEEV